MRTALGEEVVAQLVAPAAPASDMGARIEVPYTRQIVSYWRPAELVEIVDLADNPALAYEVTLEGPPGAGDYLIVFNRAAPDPDESISHVLPLAVG